MTLSSGVKRVLKKNGWMDGCADKLSSLNFHFKYKISLLNSLYAFIICRVLNSNRCYCAGAKAAVMDPDTEGIEYIDEGGHEENNNVDRDGETRSEFCDDSDQDSVEHPGALHINKVNSKHGARERERGRLRVCVEITHPALQLPVYRTWTGTQILLSLILCKRCRG